MATIWHASAAFMSMIPWPYTAPSRTSPENGSAADHPWETGLVSMWPVITTRGPEPRVTSPMALGRSGSTGWSSTASNPYSAMVSARNEASGPSSPSTLGMRQT